MNTNIDAASTASSSGPQRSYSASFWDQPLVEIEIAGRIPRWLPVVIQALGAILSFAPWHLALACLAAHLAFVTAGGGK